jgi:hypothetical protein
MGRVDVLRTAHPGSINKGTQQDIVVSPARDRYVKRVEYGFHKGTLYRVETQYRPERIPGGVEALILRLKETYGAPVIEDAMTFAPAPGILSEKRIVWNDGRTEIAFIGAGASPRRTHWLTWRTVCSRSISRLRTRAWPVAERSFRCRRDFISDPMDGIARPRWLNLNGDEFFLNRGLEELSRIADSHLLHHRGAM